MRWIYRVERRLGRNFGVTNIMLYLTATMLAFYLAWMIIMPGLFGLISFSRELILSGQFWRVITFVLLPPYLPPVRELSLWPLLTLFIAYRIGTNLEYVWGKTLFNMYLFFGMLGAIIAGFITGFATTYYIFLSLILAFCYLNPNATFLLFFIVPIKAKHIAFINWALYIWSFIQGNFSTRVAIIFSLLNFFLFFGPTVWRNMRQNYNTLRRRREFVKNWGDQNPWR